MGKVYRREQRAFVSDNGRWREEHDDWEEVEVNEVDGDVPRWWYTRVEPAANVLGRIVIGFAVVYILAVTLAIVWGAR